MNIFYRIGCLCATWLLIGGLSTHVSAQTAESINPHGSISIPCQDCHTSAAWRPIRADLAFDHNTQTEYELKGTHEITPCRGCHLELRLDQPKLDGDPCGICHVDVHQGRFIESCEFCHDMESFEEVNVEPIHNQTAFPLTGAHRDVACQSCHFDDIAGAYTQLDTNCIACHEVIRLPSHIELGFPLECELCHSTFAWNDELFNHAIVAQGFSLVGAHSRASCESCHTLSPSVELLFSPTDQNDCFSCHEGGYNRDHAGTGFPTTCLDCHNQETWFGAQFNHAVVSQGFALVGAHSNAPCSSCHNVANNFEPLFAPAGQNDCFTCHEDDYERRHGGSGFSTNCLDCHNTDTWNQ